MMNFFRKYERSFLMVITGLVIASFIFFGANSTFNEAPQIEDRVVALALDGSKLMRSDVQNLSRFLATDRWDQAQKNGFGPNFCNDGVIRFDLLKAGLAKPLVSRYFPAIKKTVEEKLDRVKRFRPYAHPDAPFLSATSVWERFVPELSSAISDLQKEETATPQIFSQLHQLYELEARCPSEWMRRILHFQQQQHSWLKPDPQLEHRDLSLFGFHSLSDWFGSDFIDLCSQLILNTARFAEQKGYRVSIEEAKADLMNQFGSTVKKIRESNPKADFSDLNFHSHLKMLGFDEKSAAEIWRNVLLFRRYFQGVGDAIFIDRMPYSDFASFALESAVIQLYEWPEALRLKQFSDLLQLQFYIDAISKKDAPLALPSQILPLEEIERETPQLVQRSYTAKISKTSVDEVGLRASVKEVWEWQLDESHWGDLQKQFPFLKNGADREERFHHLESLAQSDRLKVDTYTRKKLVEMHPEWIISALNGASQEREIQASKGFCSLPHIQHPDQFIASLEASVFTEMPIRYSDDGAIHYQISDVKSIQERHLLTFEEAKKQGLLEKLVSEKLEKCYPDIRSRFPKKFKTEEGKWKPFAEVKDWVGSYVYESLLKEIDRIEPQEPGEAEGSLESYVIRRLLPQTRKTLAALQLNPHDLSCLQKKEGDGLIEQFKMEQKEHQVQRIGKEEWMKQESLTYFPNQWSPIHVALGGSSFFYFKEKRAHRAPILEQLVMGKETIAKDAQRFLAESLLDEIINNESIVIPIQGEINELI